MLYLRESSIQPTPFRPREEVDLFTDSSDIPQPPDPAREYHTRGYDDDKSGRIPYCVPWNHCRNIIEGIAHCVLTCSSGVEDIYAAHLIYIGFKIFNMMKYNNIFPIIRA